MWNKIKKIYVWSQQVRPAYLYKYEYNFIGKTISQIANDWWQGTSWWTNTSDGIYRNSWNNPLYISLSWLGTALSNAKKVTMNVGAYVTKWTWARDLTCRVWDQWQTNLYFWLYFWWGSWDNIAIPWNSFTYTYNWATVFTLVYDLVNKTLNITSTDWTSKSPSSFSLTDSYIASIVNWSQILIKQNGTYDKMQSVYLKIE